MRFVNGDGTTALHANTNTELKSYEICIDLPPSAESPSSVPSSVPSASPTGFGTLNFGSTPLRQDPNLVFTSSEATMEAWYKLYLLTGTSSGNDNRATVAIIQDSSNDYFVMIAYNGRNLPSGAAGTADVDVTTNSGSLSVSYSQNSGEATVINSQLVEGRYGWNFDSQDGLVVQAASGATVCFDHIASSLVGMSFVQGDNTVIEIASSNQEVVNNVFCVVVPF
ncbi:expressed unknown protein [Seminavis robusta]|uniref:Uncharacterized protein n=1 Tax=Seminavis robusta TaxID=568900 RepID=A0A9N8D9J1_9STRA|nr:expressed unknown protein [Seminavis robusta]|eukprot:Sro8_g006630.1 n/a (224) ;mRNA; r:83903-84674